MGSSASFNSEIMTGMKLEELPEGCISEIISRTTPLDACRSSVVSKLFHSAAGSDSVWERFLPSDYQDIISTSHMEFSFKKDIYFSLCNTPILVDFGTKSFRLDKASGKKCYLVGARALSLAWQDEPRYWVWTSHPNSRFDEVACLRLVWWFDITGHLDTRLLSPNTTYAAFLLFKLAENDYGLDQVFKSYVNLVSDGEGENDTDEIYLKQICFKTIEQARRPPNLHLPRVREDGWMEIEMGDFLIPREDDEAKLVRMQVQEVQNLGGKSGIILEGIEVRPM